MNTYKYFYKNKSGTLDADTSYRAQLAAQAQLGVKDRDRHKITVVLLAKDGEQVVHDTSGF